MEQTGFRQYMEDTFSFCVITWRITNHVRNKNASTLAKIRTDYFNQTAEKHVLNLRPTKQK